MYLLHAYNPAGLEPAGWPKLTGGWLAQPPTLGDVDGDGLLKWPRTRARATCISGIPMAPRADGRSRQQRPVVELSPRRVEHRQSPPDTRPPERVLSLAATSTVIEQVDVTWTAPGDDGACGQAGAYQLAWSANPLTAANFDSANPVSVPAPQAASAAESASFSAPQNFTFVGLRALDEAGNPGGSRS